MAIITTNDNRRYQTADVTRTNSGMIIGGAATAACTTVATTSLRKFIGNKTSQISQSCNLNTLYGAVGAAFTQSGLADKGVKIINITTPKNSNYTPPFNLKLKFSKKILKRIEELKKGKNACFVPETKKILINMEKIGVAAFHEIGHAMNYNFSKFWGCMQKVRIQMPKVAGGIMLAALLTRKKVDGEKPQNSFDKAATFVKNNVGKLVLLTFVPTIAEELKASHNGNKMAAEVLGSDMLKKIKTSNKLGALSYISGAILTAGAAVAGSKIRDEITKPKEITD